MAEPVTSKATVLAALAVFVGPLAAQYSLILAVGLIGGFIGLSIRQDKLPGWVKPLGHVAAGTSLALVVTPLGAVMALKMAPTGWELELDLVLPVVAACVSIWWHPAVTRWVPGMLSRKAGEPTETKTRGKRK